MQLAMIGLGRMGLNMARRLLRGGHQVVAFNRSAEKTEQLVAEDGAERASSLEQAVELLRPPRVVWVMLPAAVVDQHLALLGDLLEPGDVVVEGGNSHYKDDLRRAEELAAEGIGYLDVGVSGGVWGLSAGYCLMAGGPAETFALLEPAFRTMAPPEGYLHCGPVGSGHYVKMIHNAIEYGMMQAYAEGFELLESGPYAEHHDYQAISKLWNQGSVVRSWLLELLENAFAGDPRLKNLEGFVDDSGEGRWSVLQAVESATPAPVITLALMQRFRSRQENTFADRLLAALRNQFGGHAVKAPSKGGEA